MVATWSSAAFRALPTSSAEWPTRLPPSISGTSVQYEITGLDPGADHVLGFSAWDADRNGRRQSLRVNGRDYLTDFTPVAWHADKPTYTRMHLPLPREAAAGGRMTVTMTAVAGPNAVISELWLLRRKQPAAKRVLILTGDDFPAHLWRETGPEFAAILRADPRLEVTISESPALLGSPVLSSYDAVFLHFKNYAEPPADRGAAVEESRILCQWRRRPGHRPLRLRRAAGMERLRQCRGTRLGSRRNAATIPTASFLVRILQTGHPATMGITDFTTTDELYTCLTGDTEIDVLAEATSKVDQSVQPMAFVLTPGKGRVFNCSARPRPRGAQGPRRARSVSQGHPMGGGSLKH